jgi:polyisoprenoid-binding protein YceI
LALGGSTGVDVQSGFASFEAATNMPGVEVKGKSNALSAHVDLSRDDNNLLIEQIKATLPVKSLATGMKVRDEHMRKYIFTAADGSEPDLQFIAAPIRCPAGSHEFTCEIAGSMSIRGVARPFSMQLRVKEQSGSLPVFHASGDAILKLSDYGIEPPSQFGVKPANQVKFHVDFNAKGTASLSASTTGGTR